MKRILIPAFIVSMILMIPVLWFVKDNLEYPISLVQVVCWTAVDVAFLLMIAAIPITLRINSKGGK